MTTETTERDLVAEVEELLANAAHGPLMMIRYEHGGGRLYRGEPRDLIADFYDAGNRELYYAAPELLRCLVEEVKALRRGEFICRRCHHRKDAEFEPGDF